MDAEINIFTFNDYRSWLSAAFSSRIEKNPQLSISSLATKVGMSQSLLSLILRGKRKLTFPRAEAVSQYLELSAREHTYLNLLIQLEQTQEVNSRSAIARKLEEFAQGDVESESSSIHLTSKVDGITKVVHSNPAQIALAKEAMKSFAAELEAILGRGDRTSLVNISLSLS